ncbi:DUF1559 family PulG-like putative transporter [Pirellulimonas nuda]|uniref:DUF1559 family PulG-like putative transporter n=1 Tax=Pirellulimonas nuda TaxID=2528009 RepID=UPI0018D31F9D|nr:DUF1559 domain-containing protein [Pirellulimonas nuda]
MAATNAFTLVELLTAIAIVGILIALLLPAVQQAREAARNVQCKSRLRQLAIASSNYESAQGQLPSAGDVEYDSGTAFPSSGALDFDVFMPKQGRQIGWGVTLLPYLEEQPLFDRFDLDAPLFLQPGDPQATRLPMLVCPSDFGDPAPFQHPTHTLGRPLAKGNFAAFCSPFHVETQLLAPGAIIGRGQPLRKVTDGISHTLAFSEVRTRDHAFDERGAWALPSAGASLLAFDMHPDATCYPYVPFGGPYGSGTIADQTQRPNTLGPNQDVIRECPEPADAQLAGMPCWGTSAGFLSAAPRSQHPAGVNAAALDGSVRLLTDDIDAFLMAYLISINDGFSDSSDTPQRPSSTKACPYRVPKL